MLLVVSTSTVDASSARLALLPEVQHSTMGSHPTERLALHVMFTPRNPSYDPSLVTDTQSPCTDFSISQHNNHIGRAVMLPLSSVWKIPCRQSAQLHTWAPISRPCAHEHL